MTARAHISFKTKLAAALCSLVREENGSLVPVIPFEHAKMMTADQVLSLFEWDHYPRRKTDGGPGEHWNLVPRLISEHRVKTAKIDQPEIAKGRRVTAAHDEFCRKVLERPCGQKQETSRRWPRRAFPKKVKR